MLTNAGADANDPELDVPEVEPELGLQPVDAEVSSPEDFIEPTAVDQEPSLNLESIMASFAAVRVRLEEFDAALSQSVARLQMPQVAGEGLSDDVKRAIIKPLRNILSLPNAHAREASCSADGILNWWIQLRTGCAVQEGTRGKTTSDTFVYVGTNGGSVDPAAAADAVYAYYRATNETWFHFCKLMASTSMKSMPLSMCRSTRRSSIQSHLILLGHQLISINPYSHVESMQRLARSSELSRCNRCERLGRCRR